MVRTVIDPVTRIEGHLRVELEVENNLVTDAWVSGTLFRGMELVMKDRAPADAFFVTQRICGVCPVSHGHTSSMATEAAFNVTIPNNARIIRNIVEGAQFLHSHILWFYNLAALDWVDVSQALKADVANTYALAEQVGTSTADFAAVQALFLSVKNALVIFGGTRDARVNQAYLCLYNGSAEQPHIPPTVTFVETLAQIPVSATLIFLFLLAVKNRFKIK